MSDYYTEQPQTVRPPDKASGMAIAALVLGILGNPCCCACFTGVPALVLGWMENSKINRGESSPKGKWMAITGIVMGVISLILFCLGVLWYVFFGGLAVIQAMMENMR